ncbi:MAG: carboxypeptidase-like regulatory domain-containing protein, partial [Gemmatimonadetes bacterium]|nr:carboxypeptidase-like regulatory domain-containing protein [Gemmatimonadota bacterium]
MSVVGGQLLEYETGRPLDGAAVSLASGPGPTRGIGTRVTDSDGRFLFRTVPPGSYRLVVRFLGFRDLRDTLEVAPGSDLDLALSLSVSPIELEPLVVVSDRRPPLGPLRDFERRRERMNGTFLDREEIERR